MLDKTDIQRIATASVGALILSIACVSAAVGPARAAERAAPQQFAAEQPVQASASLRG